MLVLVVSWSESRYGDFREGGLVADLVPELAPKKVTVDCNEWKRPAASLGYAGGPLGKDQRQRRWER